MTNQHPLTDEMCHELSGFPLDEFAEVYADGIMTDMRAAYDLAIEHVYETWNQLFEKAEKDSTVWLVFNNELRGMLLRQQQENN